MKQTIIEQLLGGISPADYISYSLFALIGLVVSLLIDVGDPGNIKIVLSLMAY